MDGVIYLKFDVNSDFYIGDHNPQFHIELVFLNLLIFEFRIYNVNHVEHENIEKLEIPCPNCGKTVNVRLEE
jgi:hypothetical protein